MSFNGIVVAEMRRLDHTECQHVATKTALDGVTRFSGIMGRGRTALSYDGTVATRCGELTTDDAKGQFRMSIRPKSGTFYDGTLEINNST